MTFFDFNKNSSNVVDHLRSGEANATFSLLDGTVQQQIIDRVQNLDQQGQSEALSQLKGMDLGELIAYGSEANSGVMAPGGQKSYEVKSGDSLSKIARAHDVSLKEILRANPQIKNPDLIHPRDIVRIP